MLVVMIIILVIMAIAVILLYVQVCSLKSSIEDTQNKITVLHEKYWNHEDRIDCNYKSLAELNRRQDEWMRRHTDSDEKIQETINQLELDVVGLQEYKENREKVAKEIWEEFDKMLKDSEEPSEEEDCNNKRATILNEKRSHYATLRKQGMSVANAAKSMGISRSTSTRYEKWYKEQDI